MFNVLFGSFVLLVNLVIASISATHGSLAATLMGLNYSPILNGLLLLFGLAFVPFAERNRGRRMLIVTLLPLIGVATQLLLMLAV